MDKGKIDLDAFYRYPSFGRSLYNPMLESCLSNTDSSSTSPLNPSRGTPKPINFGVKGTCKKCPEGSNFLQITSTMNNQEDARAEFYDIHNQHHDHLFEGEPITWELMRPEAMCDGPDPATRACMKILRNRASKTQEEPQASRGYKAREANRR